MSTQKRARRNSEITILLLPLLIVEHSHLLAYFREYDSHKNSFHCLVGFIYILLLFYIFYKPTVQGISRSKNYQYPGVLDNQKVAQILIYFKFRNVNFLGPPMVRSFKSLNIIYGRKKTK